MGILSSKDVRVGHKLDRSALYASEFDRKVKSGVYKHISSVSDLGDDYAYCCVVDHPCHGHAAGKYAMHVGSNPHIAQLMKYSQQIASAHGVSVDVVNKTIKFVVPIITGVSASCPHAVMAAAKEMIPESAPVVAQVLAMTLALPQGEGKVAQLAGNKSATITSKPLSGEGQFRNLIGEHAYRGAMEHMRAGHTIGGCGCVSGGHAKKCECKCAGKCTCHVKCKCKCKVKSGSDEIKLDTIKDYVDSVYSSTKQGIIKAILSAMQELNFKPSGSTPQEQLRSILQQIPHGDKFKRDPQANEIACRKIGEVLNKSLGTDVINMSAGIAPEAICQQIAEVISSLSSGMHSEFIAVYSDVRRVLGNLEALQKLLNANLVEVTKILNESKDELTKAKAAENREIYTVLIKELERQHVMLKNLLSITLMPASKDFESILKNTKGVHGYIEKINESLGTKEYGNVIHNMLTSVTNVGYAALIVQSALEHVGMKVSEYVNSGSLQELKEKILPKIIKSDEKAMNELLEAYEVLASTFNNRAEVAKHIKGSYMPTSISGAGSCSGGLPGAYNVLGGLPGAYNILGAADEYKLGPTEVVLQSRTKARQLIYSAFFKQIQDLFDKFIVSLDTLSHKVGTEIPLGDSLDSFRSGLTKMRFALLNRKEIYMALIGYYNDAMSASQKDEFVGALRVVEKYIDAVLADSKYSSCSSYFNDLKGTTVAIIALIDRYSDEMTAKFGRGETSISGGADVDSPIYEVWQQKFANSKTISDAIIKFDYYYKSSQIRDNLKRTGVELKSYAENYEGIVAESIAEYLGEMKKKHDKALKALDADVAGNQHDGTTPIVMADASTHIKDEAAVKSNRDSAKEFFDSQWNTRLKFWKTVEAIDKYMQLFTDAMVNNIGDIKDIRSMIDSVEVIDDWYTNGTGNLFASIFDYFPTSLSDDGVSEKGIPYPDKKLTDLSDDHYYERIKNANPGNPFIVTMPNKGMEALARAKRSFSGFAILKNLISVFHSLGSKFGGKAITTFLTPAQMYNNLVEYICASAFAQGWGTGDTSYQLSGDVTVSGSDFGVGGNIGINYSPDDLSKGPTGLSPAQYQRHFKRRWGVWCRSTHEKLRAVESDFSSFKTEDKYFVMVIKSLAAKILTVTGMYDVMDRPYDVIENNSLRPIRMIIGGSSIIPKVEDGATALYLRLPLLCQFYRKIFGYYSEQDNKKSDATPRRNKWRGSDINRNDSKDGYKISLVPDFEGTFSGLIRLMFRQTRLVSDQSYSDTEVAEIIKECNLVYQKVAGKSANPVMDAVNDLVAEVNRRYGIVVKNTRNKYENEFGTRYSYAKVDPNDSGKLMENRYLPEGGPYTHEFALLPGEMDAEIELLSPSEKVFRTSSINYNEKKTKKSAFAISEEFNNVLKNFRCELDGVFERASDNKFEQFSFHHAIKTAQHKLKAEQNDEKRFSIICQLIRGEGVYNQIDEQKYVLFHETVVTGLNTLSAIHTILARFQKVSMLLDIEGLQSLTMKAIRGSAGDTQAIVDNVARLLGNTKQFQEVDPMAKNMLELICGKGEDAAFAGGLTDAHAATYTVKMTDGIKYAGLERVAGIAVPGGVVTSIAAGSHGLSNLLIGLPVDQLEHPTKKSDTANRVETFMRYFINREFTMKLLLETLYGLTGDTQGLITVSESAGKLFMKWNDLKTLVEDLFHHVNHFIEVLRPHISNSIIDKYVSKLNPGSYFWLQENLMEKIIVGRPESIEYGNRFGHENHFGGAYHNIDECMRKISHTFNWLTKSFEYTVDNAANSGLVKVDALGPADKEIASHNHFDKILAEMIFYDARKPQSGLIKSGQSDETIAIAGVGAAGTYATGIAKLVDFMHDPYESLHLAGPPTTKTLDTRTCARFQQLYTWQEEVTMNRSALFSFNQLVAKYIQSFYDTATSKIYYNVIDKFANGTFSRAVHDITKTYPDIAPCVMVGRESRSFFGTTALENILLSWGGKGTIEDRDALADAFLHMHEHEAFPAQLTLDSACAASDIKVLDFSRPIVFPDVPNLNINFLIRIMAAHVHGYFNVIDRCRKIAACMIALSTGTVPATAAALVGNKFTANAAGAATSTLLPETILHDIATTATEPYNHLTGLSFTTLGEVIAHLYEVMGVTKAPAFKVTYDNLKAKNIAYRSALVPGTVDATIAAASVIYRAGPDAINSNAIYAMFDDLFDWAVRNPASRKDLVETLAQMLPNTMTFAGALDTQVAVAFMLNATDKHKLKHDVTAVGGMHITMAISEGQAKIVNESICDLLVDATVTSVVRVQAARAANRAGVVDLINLSHVFANGDQTVVPVAFVVPTVDQIITKILHNTIPVANVATGGYGPKGAPISVADLQKKFDRFLTIDSDTTHYGNIARPGSAVAFAVGTKRNPLAAGAEIAGLGIHMASSGGAATHILGSISFNEAFKKLQSLMKLYNVYLSETSDTFESLASLAYKAMPEKDLTKGRKVEHNAKSFMSIIMNLSQAKPHVSPTATAAAVSGVYKKMTEPTTAPSSPLPTSVVEYKDIANINLTLPLNSTNVNSEHALLFARNGSISGGPDNSIEDIDRTIYASPSANRESDKLPAISNFGERMDPDADHVLFTSLAVILKTLTSTRTLQNQAVVYLQENIADVPAYMKEKMRVNLPAFRTMFRELSARCEYIKSMMNIRDVSCLREEGTWNCDYYHGVANGVPTHNPWPYVLVKPTGKSTAVKSRFSGILDTIIQGCNTLANSCESVLKEIPDECKYFETYQNSIKDYKAQHGMEPFMPLSSTAKVFANIGGKSYLELFPIHTPGEAAFKFMYGTRDILQHPTKQISGDVNGGLMQAVDAYNAITDSRFHASKDQADKFLKSYVKAIRFIYGAKHVKGLLTSFTMMPNGAAHTANSSLVNVYGNENVVYAHTNGMITRGDMIVTNKARCLPSPVVERIHAAVDKTMYGTNQVIIDNRSDVSMIYLNKEDDQPLNASLYSTDEELKFRARIPIPTFAACSPLASIIEMIESSKRSDQVKKLVDHFSRSEYDKPNDSDLAVQNVIDLNIIPINVHALMREIPLANLYNYSYTFDRMIAELYYDSSDSGAIIKRMCEAGSQPIDSARDALVQLLVDPYYDQTADKHSMVAFGEHVKNMLMGLANHGEMGRPKFLSDQVYGKIIFGDLFGTYDSSNDYSNEVGPISGEIGTRAHIHAFTFEIMRLFILSSTEANGKFRHYFDALKTSNNMRLIHNIIDINLDDQMGTWNSIRDKIYSLLKSKQSEYPFYDLTEGAGATIASACVLADALAIVSKFIVSGCLYAYQVVTKTGNYIKAHDELMVIIGSIVGVNQNLLQFNADGYLGLTDASPDAKTTFFTNKGSRLNTHMQVSGALVYGLLVDLDNERPLGVQSNMVKYASTMRHLLGIVLALTYNSVAAAGGAVPPNAVGALIANLPAVPTQKQLVWSVFESIITNTDQQAAAGNIDLKDVLGPLTINDFAGKAINSVATSATKTYVRQATAVHYAIGIIKILNELVNEQLLDKYDTRILASIIAGCFQGVTTVSSVRGRLAGIVADTILHAKAPMTNIIPAANLANQVATSADPVHIAAAGAIAPNNANILALTAAIINHADGYIIPVLPSREFVNFVGSLSKSITEDAKPNNSLTAAPPCVVAAVANVGFAVKYDVMISDVFRKQAVGSLSHIPGTASPNSLRYAQGNKKPSTVSTLGDTDNLAKIGQNRFDTVLVRNIIFIVNLYRSIRLKLQRDLTYNREIIARSSAITNPKMTEFYSNQSWKDRHLQRYNDDGVQHRNPEGKRRGIN